MHCRDITQAEFDAMLRGLINAERQDGDIEVVRGWHDDHGSTVLIRDPVRCMALVEEPGCIDGWRAEEAATTDGALVARAMRAGKSR